jgi:hypothetical protein
MNLVAAVEQHVTEMNTTTVAAARIAKHEYEHNNNIT